MFATRRRNVLAGAGAFVLATTLVGCNSGGTAGGISEDDVVLGAAEAPITLIEYASATCPHCADWHGAVFPQFKQNYIDTGKVRYVFREYPTNPPALAVAAFQVARCGGATPEQYFARLSEIFRTQQAMFQALRVDGGRQHFIDMGAAAGLSSEQVLQCIADESGAERVRRIVEGGDSFNVTGTPTFIINGQKVEDPSVMTYEGLARLLDAQLPS